MNHSRRPTSSLSAWSKQFTDFCDRFKAFLNDEAAVRYLTYCYANTMASTLATDEWGMATYDRDRSVYSDQDKAERRMWLSESSVKRLRSMAAKVCELAETDDKDAPALFKQVCEVLDQARVVKFDEEKKQELVKCLPIYETMRTILAYELLQGRPIILSVYEIKCTPHDEIPGWEQFNQKGKEEEKDVKDYKSIYYKKINKGGYNATYSVEDVVTVLYQPDKEEKKFKPVVVRSKFRESGELDTETGDRPCLAIQAYHLFRDGDPIPVDDEADLSKPGAGYLGALLSCDLALLVQCYAAIHPVYAGTSLTQDGTLLNGKPRKEKKKEEEEKPEEKLEEKQDIERREDDDDEPLNDEAVDHMKNVYEKVCGSLDQWANGDIKRRSSRFSLIAPVYTLWSEYEAMRNLAEKCGVQNKLYCSRLLGEWIERLGGKQTLMARALDSCAFSIHHMNTNSFKVVSARDDAARKSDPLGRFHDIDAKVSNKDWKVFVQQKKDTGRRKK